MSPLQFVQQRLALQEALQVEYHNLKGPILLVTRLPRHVRRDKTVLGFPQRVLTGQRLRVGHIERRAANLARLEGVHERRLVDDGATGNIHKEWGSAGGPAQDVELLLSKQTVGGLGQGEAEHEHVEVGGGEEGVQVGPGGAVGPGRGEEALRVAEAWDVEGAVAAGGRGGSRGGGVGVDGHAHGFADAGDLAADGAVADDASG